MSSKVYCPKGSLVNVWLLNNMETIIQSQGLQHIVEKSFLYLDKESINRLRLVNKDFKGITESPRVLRVLKARKLAVIKGFLFNSIKGWDDDDDEWKRQLFKLLQSQCLKYVEANLFELLCKVLDDNIYYLFC